MDTFFTCICWEGVHNATHENGKYIVIYRLMHRYQKTTSRDDEQHVSSYFIFFTNIYYESYNIHLKYRHKLGLLTLKCSYFNYLFFSDAQLTTIYSFWGQLSSIWFIFGPIINVYLVHFEANHQLYIVFWGQLSTIHCMSAAPKWEQCKQLSERIIYCKICITPFSLIIIRHSSTAL